MLDAEKYNQTQNLAEGAKDFCGKVSQLNDIVKSVVEAVDQQVSERRHARVDAGMPALKKKKKLEKNKERHRRVFFFSFFPVGVRLSLCCRVARSRPLSPTHTTSKPPSHAHAHSR